MPPTGRGLIALAPEILASGSPRLFLRDAAQGRRIESAQAPMQFAQVIIAQLSQQVQEMASPPLACCSHCGDPGGEARAPPADHPDPPRSTLPRCTSIDQAVTVLGLN